MCSPWQQVPASRILVPAFLTYCLSPFCGLSHPEKNLQGLWGIITSLTFMKCIVHLRHHSETKHCTSVSLPHCFVFLHLCPWSCTQQWHSTGILHCKYLTCLRLTLVFSICPEVHGQCSPACVLPQRRFFSSICFHLVNGKRDDDKALLKYDYVRGSVS